MAKGKTPTTRKGAAVKAAGKPKPRKRSIKKPAAKPGKGHNNPPPDLVPPSAPPFTGWLTDNSAQVAHATAARQSGYRAATGIVTPTTGTPFALAHDPNYLHWVMLNRIAALEETIEKLATLPDAEQITPSPLDDSEIEEIRRTLVKLRALPPVPTQRPTDAVEVPNKFREFGEKVLYGNGRREMGRLCSSDCTVGELQCSTESRCSGYRRMVCKLAAAAPAIAAV
jgi:hypothetical protein